MTSGPRSVALVTGAGSGVGRAIAVALARDGVTIGLVGRRIEPLEETMAEIRSAGGEGLVLPADLSDTREVERLASRAVTELGRMDVLVHSAGLFHRGPIAGTDAETLDALYRTNVHGPMQLTRELLAPLEDSRGSVLFVNSSAVGRAAPDIAAYAASKSGLKAFADALREEVNASGIRVTSIYLGRTATPMQQRVHELEGREYRPDRLIQPADVARLVHDILQLAPTTEVTDVHLRPGLKPIPSENQEPR